MTHNHTTPPDAHLWPLTTLIDENGRLIIGGCDVAALTQQYGTPLYLFDEMTIRAACMSCLSHCIRRSLPWYNRSALRWQGAAQCRNCADHRR